MPKKIEGLKEIINAETKKQIKEKGFSGITVISVAKGAKVGVGTVYANFSNKEELLFCYMFDEWTKYHERMYKRVEQSSDPLEKIKSIYEELSAFYNENAHVINDPGIKRAFGTVMTKYLNEMLDNIKDTMRPIASKMAIEDEELSLLILSEMIVKFVSKYDFERVKPFFEHMIK